MSIDAVRMALGTLTAVPVPPPRRLDPPVPGRAMMLAPAAGLVPGAAAAVLAWVAVRVGLFSLVTATLCIGVLALATRGLHLDGLADTADGLAASYDRARALEVMKRGDVGPAGAVTVTLVVLLQVAALAEALARIGPPAVAVAAVAGRLAVPLACLRPIPPARGEGLGTRVAGSVGPAAVVACSLLVLGAVTATLAGVGVPWWTGGLVVVAALAAAGAVVWRAVRRLGGITGDVIGAAVEVGTAAALVALAAV